MLAGVAAARAAGLHPVKINSVLLRGVNDHEAPDLLHWAMAEGVQLRFIEQMPLDAQHGWQRTEMVTAAEIRDRLSEQFELVEDEQDAALRGSAPAELFRVAGTDYAVGIIASVTKPFCGACDRVRLTADGQIRNCLFARTESDLRTPLRERGRRRPRSPGGGWRRYGASRPATASTTRASCSPTGRCRPSAAELASRPPAPVRPEESMSAGLPFSDAMQSDATDADEQTLDLAEEAAGGQEPAQGVAVLGTGQPVLAPLRRVDLRVVPAQVVRRRLPAALGRAEQLVRQPAWSRCSAVRRSLGAAAALRSLGSSELVSCGPVERHPSKLAGFRLDRWLAWLATMTAM